MNCEFCGEEISQGSLACPRCGSPVSASAAKEKPTAPPPSKDSPDAAAGEPAPGPRAPEKEQPEESGLDWVVPGIPRAVQPSDTPAWEIQAPVEEAPKSPAPPALEQRPDHEATTEVPPRVPAPPPLEQPPAFEAPPELPPKSPAPPALEQPPEYEAPAVPLAKQEEDFIALAEEKAQMERLPEPPADTDSEVLPAEYTPAPETAVIESALAGGPEAETAVDSDLTGGHKGGFAGASVAGAGVQTTDDPFGLNVTETAPPMAEEEATVRQFNWAKWRNIGIMIVAFLVAASIAAAGLYFGFLHKSNAPATDPVETVSNFCKEIISGSSANLNEVSVPGSQFQQELSSMLEPYEKMGVLTVNDFEAAITKETGTSATVEIKKFVVKSLTTTGETEYLDVLSMNTPVPLRKTVSLVKQNGKWLVSD